MLIYSQIVITHDVIIVIELPFLLIRWNLTMDCNAGCNCGQSMSYNPICSFDKSTTFYSPCHAGCTQTIIDGALKVNKYHIIQKMIF